MNGSECNQKDINLVKSSLLQFLQSQIDDEDCLESGNDEIVLNYITNVLEDLGTDQRNYKEQFDVEEFKDILGAYFPGFADIDSSLICDWVFKLTDELVHMRSNGANGDKSSKRNINLTVNTDMCQSSTNLNGSQCSSSSSPVSPITFSHSSSLSSSPVTKISKLTESHAEWTTSKTTSKFCKKSQNHERQHKSSLSDKDDCDDCDCKEQLELHLEKEVELLQEMFPNVSLLEVTHCLSVMDGDTEKAAQLIMHRLDSKESYSSTPLQITVNKLRTTPKNDKELKAHILSRYAFVDKADDEREHKPVAPKTQPKKLIRYRNNKIVSIKGEKYTELNADSD